MVQIDEITYPMYALFIAITRVSLSSWISRQASESYVYLLRVIGNF